MQYQSSRVLFQYECRHRELLWYVTIRKKSPSMLRFEIAFFCGAPTVASFVVATGARTSGWVMLGFVATNILYGLVICAVRPRRLGRLLLRLSGERQQLKPGGAVRKRAAVRASEVEQQVISALVCQGAKSSTARKATTHAALNAPQEFEPLFKVAVVLLTSSVAA